MWAYYIDIRFKCVKCNEIALDEYYIRLISGSHTFSNTLFTGYQGQHKIWLF